MSLGDDLATLKAVQFVQRHVAPERVVYKVNAVLGLAEAVESGIGIGFLPCFIRRRGLARLSSRSLTSPRTPGSSRSGPSTVRTGPRVPRLPRGRDRQQRKLIEATLPGMSSLGGRKRSRTPARTEALITPTNDFVLLLARLIGGLVFYSPGPGAFRLSAPRPCSAFGGSPPCKLSLRRRNKLFTA